MKIKGTSLDVYVHVEGWCYFSPMYPFSYKQWPFASMQFFGKDTNCHLTSPLDASPPKYLCHIERKSYPRFPFASSESYCFSLDSRHVTRCRIIFTLLHTFLLVSREPKIRVCILCYWNYERELLLWKKKREKYKKEICWHLCIIETLTLIHSWMCMELEREREREREKGRESMINTSLIHQPRQKSL